MYAGKKILETVLGTDCMYVQSRKNIYDEPKVNVSNTEGKESVSSSCGGAEVRNAVRM